MISLVVGANLSKKVGVLDQHKHIVHPLVKLKAGLVCKYVQIY